jgi:ABC-type glycerol-3-phosphate transport system permease component
MAQNFVPISTPVSPSLPERKPWSLNRILLLILGAVLSIVFLFPFFWAISSSLKGPTEIFMIPPRLFPIEPRWYNYVRIWEMVPLARFFQNTLIITVIALTGTLISSTLVAYGFARFNFPGRNILFILVIGTLILPSDVTLVPRFIIYNQLKWIDTWLPLTVPEFFAVNAFLIFLLRQFIMSIPRELDEAAEMDGAGSLRILWAVILPLIKPALATVAIFAFLGTWNSFVDPMIFLRTTELFPISVGLRFFQTGPEMGGEPREALLMAASLLMSLPPIVIYLFAQRYYVQGIVMSGIKG